MSDNGIPSAEPVRIRIYIWVVIAASVVLVGRLVQVQLIDVPKYAAESKMSDSGP